MPTLTNASNLYFETVTITRDGTIILKIFVFGLSRITRENTIIFNYSIVLRLIVTLRQPSHMPLRRMLHYANISHMPLRVVVVSTRTSTRLCYGIMMRR